MKNDPETTALVEVGSVVQIDPQIDHEWCRGKLAHVTDKRSWGVVAIVPTDKGPAPMRLTWMQIEPTGGKMVWDADGVRLRETALPLKHHP